MSNANRPSVIGGINDTDGQPQYALIENSTGALKVTSSGGGGGGAVTIADGADVAEGATTDAKVTGDNPGTVSAKLRGLDYLWALVVDTANQWVKVSLQASSAVIGHVITDSGSTTAVTQAAAASLNATVVGTGTFAVQAAQSGTWSVTATRQIAASETLSNVSASASNVTVLASNASRVGAIFFNDSTSSVYVKLGATASTTSFTYKLFAYQTLELPDPLYRGIVDAIWDSATGSMRVTEAA